MNNRQDDDPLTRRIIECAIDVHHELGPGLLEQAYSQAMCAALMDAKLAFVKERAFPIKFRGREIGVYRPDLIVESQVVVEIKSVDRYDPVFLAQMLTYLRITALHVGLIVNFNRARLVDGVKRVSL
jgi:GxxExxY protein